MKKYRGITINSTLNGGEKYNNILNLNKIFNNKTNDTENISAIEYNIEKLDEIEYNLILKNINDDINIDKNEIFKLEKEDNF